MFVIIEYNGDYIMGLVMDNGSGECLTFDTEEQAKSYAEENMAFEYTIAKI